MSFSIRSPKEYERINKAIDVYNACGVELLVQTKFRCKSLSANNEIFK